MTSCLTGPLTRNMFLLLQWKSKKNYYHYVPKSGRQWLPLEYKTRDENQFQLPDFSLCFFSQTYQQVCRETHLRMWEGQYGHWGAPRGIWAAENHFAGNEKQLVPQRVFPFCKEMSHGDKVTREKRAQPDGKLCGAQTALQCHRPGVTAPEMNLCSWSFIYYYFLSLVCSGGPKSLIQNSLPHQILILNRISMRWHQKFTESFSLACSPFKISYSVAHPGICLYTGADWFW